MIYELEFPSLISRSKYFDNHKKKNLLRSKTNKTVQNESLNRFMTDSAHMVLNNIDTHLNQNEFHNFLPLSI